MIKYSIGIDISKKNFHVCLSSVDVLQHVKVHRSGSFANSKVGFEQFHKWIKASCSQQNTPLFIVMEATGVYYENCAMYLSSQGYNVSVVLPNKAKKYIAALGVKTKNDKVDAKALSCMGAQQALDLWQPFSEFFYELRSLTRYNQSLKEMRTSLTNQVEAAEHSMHPNEKILEGLKKIIAQIDDQIEENVKAISTHIKSDPEVAEKVRYITAMKGVGELTVATVLGETNGFILFTSSSQVVSYGGYDVVENDSGSHKGKTKISKKGNGRIRRILHMPALCLVKYRVKPFINLFERTLAKHNIKMKSYVAVQKKLLSIIYTLWKKGEMFDENYGDTTYDVEVEHSSRVSFAEAEQNSPGQAKATQGIQPSTNRRLHPLG